MVFQVEKQNHKVLETVIIVEIMVIMKQNLAQGCITLKCLVGGTIYNCLEVVNIYDTVVLLTMNVALSYSRDKLQEMLTRYQVQFQVPEMQRGIKSAPGLKVKYHRGW